MLTRAIAFVLALTASSFAGKDNPYLGPEWDYGLPADGDPLTYAAIPEVYLEQLTFLPPLFWQVAVVDEHLLGEDEWTVASIMLMPDGRTLLVMTPFGGSWTVPVGGDIEAALLGIAEIFGWEP